MPKKFLEAGKIVGTHGIRGDLKVQSWCDTPEVLCDFDTLYLDEKTPVEVTSAQVHKNVVLMHLKGVDTVEAAEKLHGKIPMITMRMWWKWPDGSRRFDRAGMRRCGSARPSTGHTSKTCFASMRTCASCEKGA